MVAEKTSAAQAQSPRQSQSTAETDLIKLYSGRILQLAADIPHAALLEQSDARVKRRSPLCGSTVTVDLMVQDGRVADFGQDVKACALGQAAASVAGAAIVGCTEAQVRRARDQLLALLQGSEIIPDAPFEGFEVFLPAAAYKNRHASIMLTLEASVEAFDIIAQSAQND